MYSQLPAGLSPDRPVAHAIPQAAWSGASGAAAVLAELEGEARAEESAEGVAGKGLDPALHVTLR